MAVRGLLAVLLWRLSVGALSVGVRSRGVPLWPTGELAPRRPGLVGLQDQEQLHDRPCGEHQRADEQEDQSPPQSDAGPPARWSWRR